MKIGLYGEIIKKENEDLIYFFIQEIKNRGITLFIWDEYLQKLKESSYFKEFDFSALFTFSSANNFPKDLNLLFTFGGDGTILSAVKIVRDSGVPILGINMGRLGFLATLQRDQLNEKLNDILAGNYKISERSLVEIQSPDLPYCCAINEAAIIRKETTAMIKIDAYVDEVFLNSFYGDGVIISTPTGSTGYSLSCGGPIISPEENLFVITCIAPHNLNVRPLILSDKVTIRLKINSRSEHYNLTLDSSLYNLDKEQEILIKKADYKIKIVKYMEYSYFENLRIRLKWGSDYRNN